MLTQVNLQAAKSNYERELAAKEEAAEEARRSLIKQLRELEAQIDDERKQKSQALSAQKKTESELAEVESQIDAEAKGREDALRMYKKAQVSRDNVHVHCTCGTQARVEFKDQLLCVHVHVQVM